MKGFKFGTIGITWVNINYETAIKVLRMLKLCSLCEKNSKNSIIFPVMKEKNKRIFYRLL